MTIFDLIDKDTLVYVLVNAEECPMPRCEEIDRDNSICDKLSEKHGYNACDVCWREFLDQIEE